MDAADDVGLDDEIPELSPGAPLRDAVARLRAQSFPPPVDGGRAAWVLRAGGPDGRPLAVVAQQWYEPRYLVDADGPVGDLAAPADGGPVLFFEYRHGSDPAEVHAELTGP
ncbi:hypothetical protein SCATT_03820 [Streptantibioticus cattleyicolor NRRL 8057 = DSM 46488]|uniref:Uncharacterized protein n=1 Tax=Streptantibioticus cattleyicolor (strain ATCC 35852 / DSM 46488 / JCM 4925 / NBRC 14057 / NRRL 8057) TaxID=1003195 RepID=G8WNJ1_STREN|nr:hypothetical protein SCATT_03820 [Streptantibioticus cattleyicolor NRRL 8057 = DSM 46488]